MITMVTVSDRQVRQVQLVQFISIAVGFKLCFFFVYIPAVAFTHTLDMLFAVEIYV